MRLNQDCVRDVLLYVESNVKFGNFLYLEDFLNAPELNDKYDSNSIKYTLAKLDEPEYMKSQATWMNNDLVRFSTGMLTWEGHKFLDTIRDNDVWSKTKSVTSKFSSVSISTLQSVAVQVITSMIKSAINIP